MSGELRNAKLHGARGWEVFDLSQSVGPSTPRWPGWPALSAQVVCELERDGMYDRVLSLAEHTGTHLDAPAHFDPAGRFAHEFSASDLVVPCVVIDVRARCGDNRDFAVRANHL